jgi:hypothetical protein
MTANMTFHITDSSPNIEETTKNKWQMTQKEATINE